MPSGGGCPIAKGRRHEQLSSCRNFKIESADLPSHAMTDASPAQKRARTTESQASNAVASQIYRVRVSLPSHSGTRLFDMPESASLHDLHLQICEAFNRDPTAHLFAYEYPLPVHAVAMHGPSGPKTDKDTVIFLCNACGVPTEGVKLPDLKKSLNAVRKDLEKKQRATFMGMFGEDENAPLKAFHVEDDKYMSNDEYDEFPTFGSRKTKLSDVKLKPGDLLYYEWDRGSSWSHIVAIESNRNATAQDDGKGIQLIESNGLSEPEE